VSSLPKPRAQSTIRHQGAVPQNGGRRGWRHDVSKFRGRAQGGRRRRDDRHRPEHGLDARRRARRDRHDQPLGSAISSSRSSGATLLAWRKSAVRPRRAVMADEGVFTLQDAHALAQARACDAYCIKLYKMGGITNAKKIARSANPRTFASTARARGAVAARRRRQRAFLRGDPARAHDGRGRIHVRPERERPKTPCAESDFKIKTGTSKCRAATASASRSTKHCSKKIRCRRKRSASKALPEASPQNQNRNGAMGKVVKDAGAKAN